MDNVLTTCLIATSPPLPAIYKLAMWKNSSTGVCLDLVEPSVIGAEAMADEGTRNHLLQLVPKCS